MIKRFYFVLFCILLVFSIVGCVPARRSGSGSSRYRSAHRTVPRHQEHRTIPAPQPKGEDEIPIPPVIPDDSEEQKEQKEPEEQKEGQDGKRNGRNDNQERRISRWGVDGVSNLSMLDEACDFNFPSTKKFANSMAGDSPGDFNIGQVCEIFDYCFKNWRYVNDPADQEYLAKASETIGANLTGDCDDFAVLMASCIIAIGGRPSITVAWGPEGGHAYAEVDISKFGLPSVTSFISNRYASKRLSSIGHRKSMDGRIWMNLDWWSNFPGGKYFNSTHSMIYEWDGSHWKYVG